MKAQKRLWNGFMVALGLFSVVFPLVIAISDYRHGSFSISYPLTLLFITGFIELGVALSWICRQDRES